MTIARRAKLGIVLFGWLALLTAAATPAVAQTSPDDWCREDGRDHDRARVCDVRQFTVAATSGVLAIAATNGGITVTGEARSDVFVEAKVTASAASDDRARQIADAVQVNPSSDRIEADGPRGLRNREGWSVSFRIAVPRALNLSVRTANGGIVIQDVESKVDFSTSNGGVKLRRVDGDVRGTTSNGGIDVELEGSMWQGTGLDVTTSNGGVNVAIPEHYSAQLEVRTHNGGLNIDMPGVVQDRSRREAIVQLGSGGAPIRVSTSNGGVRVRRK
jgi:hypothetical protein